MALDLNSLLMQRGGRTYVSKHCKIQLLPTKKIPTILIKYGWRRLARSTCTSLIHWTDVAWWDQVRGCLKMLPFCPDPPYFPLTHPAPRPSLACPLSYMWHGCLLLPVTSQAVHWPLHFWCWQAKLEAWRPIRTHTHEHTLSSREHHPRRRRVSKWPNTGCLMSVCFASSLFSLSFPQKSIIVSLFIFHFHSSYPCFVLIFVFLSLLAVPFFFLWEVFLSFFFCCFFLSFCFPPVLPSFIVFV